MGYTNAQGTHKYLTQAANEGTAFAWHGGDISYADDWYSGILPCEDSWPVCYNGTSTTLPGGVVTDEYKKALPKGEVPNQGGPQGGDMSVLYESNWDLWQQWLGSVTTKIPYMVLPGNHEAACAEFDGPGNVLTAYLNEDKSNSTAAKEALTYYSCPPSQRNFTAYQHRFRMPGAETGGVGNFWYSFDYGLAHFVSMDGETDYANSPEWSFAEELSGNETHPKESETYLTDSGPFGRVGNVKDTKSYEQYQWLKKDLASVDRKKTPWVIVMSHRPMYSSAYSSYQKNIRAAFEGLMLEHGVDAYLSG
jgi:acid phosphatase